MESLNLNPTEPRQSELDYETISQAKGGASWFYWIAALSIINSLIFLYGANWSFFAGLGITQLIDVIVDQISRGGDWSVIKIIAFVVNLVIAGIFFLCGLWAGKFQTWAFIVGMVLYFLDGILLLVIGAYFPAGFHAFALFMIFRGLIAARQINANQDLA